MSVESTEALERSVLEGKDREQLLAIAAALGVKATSRAKKADIIAKILEQTGGPSVADTPAPARTPRGRNGNGNGRARESVPATAPALDLETAGETAPPAAAAPAAEAVVEVAEPAAEPMVSAFHTSPPAVLPGRTPCRRRPAPPLAWPL